MLRGINMTIELEIKLTVKATTERNIADDHVQKGHYCEEIRLRNMNITTYPYQLGNTSCNLCRPTSSF